MAHHRKVGEQQVLEKGIIATLMRNLEKASGQKQIGIYNACTRKFFLPGTEKSVTCQIAVKTGTFIRIRAWHHSPSN